MKVKMKYSIIILIFSVCFLVLTGCKTTQKSITVPEEKVSMPEISESVQIKISELEGKSGLSDSEDDMLQLSFLYSHTLNPEPDYKKSLVLLERYIDKAPKENRFEFAGYIKSLLVKINEQEKGIEKQKRLIRNEKKEKQSLITQNKKLRKKINSLKKLDIRLEKQRLSAE